MTVVPKIWMNVTTSVNWDRPAVGVVRVEQELSRALAKLYDDDFGLCVFAGGKFVPYDSETTVHEAGAELLTVPPAPSSFPRSRAFDPVLEQYDLGPEARRKTGPVKKRGIAYGDVILSVGLDWNYSYTDHYRDLMTDMGVKVVTFCHDVIPITRPQLCAYDVAPTFKDYFSKLSWGSSLILCNSHCTQNDYVDAMRRLGTPPAETMVVTLGDNVIKDDDSGADFSSEVQGVTSEPFILFVSSIERRKNHEVLYRAYRLLAREGHAARLPKLVFVGMAGWGVSDILNDIVLDPLTKDLIVQLNHVTDRELAHLYESAYFCAFPSLYEGWGLPVGEALARGKTVLASGEGSIPEVGGDLVTYLDPWHPRAWADEILRLVDAPEAVRAIEARVRKDYVPRTWRGTAETVKAALDRLRRPEPVDMTLYPGYDMQSLTGIASGESLRSAGAEGSLLHGPYRTLPAGTYDIAVDIDKLEGAAGQLTFEVRSNGATDKLGTVDIDFDEQEHFGVIFQMNVTIEKQVDDFEICVDVTKDLLVSLNQITVSTAAGDA